MCIDDYDLGDDVDANDDDYGAPFHWFNDWLYDI